MRTLSISNCPLSFVLYYILSYVNLSKNAFLLCFSIKAGAKVHNLFLSTKHFEMFFYFYGKKN